MSDDETSELEVAALEWLVAKNSNCGDDCVVTRKDRKPDPILDAWAKSLIGMLLKVPGWWWENWPRSDRRLYDCELVDVDYQDANERYFVVHCKFDGDDGRYLMNYPDVKKYARGVKQKDGRRFDLPDKACPTVIDEDLVALCTDTLIEATDSRNLCGFNVSAEKCHEFIFKRVCLKLDSQRVTPEKQRELALRFYKSQGRYVPWGEATATVEREAQSESESRHIQMGKHWSDLPASEVERIAANEFPFCKDGVLLEVNGRRLDVVAFGSEESVAARKMFRLCSLALEMLEDKVSLLRVVHERLTPHDHNFIHPWQTGSRTNSHERAMLECLVSMPSPEEARNFCELFQELHWEVPSFQAAVGLDSVAAEKIDDGHDLEHALMHAIDQTASSMACFEGLEPANAIELFRRTLLALSGGCSMFGAAPLEEVTGSFGGVGHVTPQKFFIRRFGDEEEDVLPVRGLKTSGETSSDYEGLLPDYEYPEEVCREKLGGVHCRPDPGLVRLNNGEGVGRTFAFGGLSSLTRQLGCFPPRWCNEAHFELDDYNKDNALTWLLANRHVLSAEDEARARKNRSLMQWAQEWAQEKEDHENEKSEEEEEEGNSVDDSASVETGCNPSDFPFSIEAWLQACRDTEVWLHCDNPLRGVWMRDVNRLFNLFLERLEDRVMFFNVVLLGLKRNPDPIIRAQAKADEVAAEEAAIALLGELDLEEMECNASPATPNQKKKRAMAARRHCIRASQWKNRES